MLQAFGLYTHIAANRRRSIILIVALFALIYALAYAGGLIYLAMTQPADLRTMLRDAVQPFLQSAPYVAVGTLVWVMIAWRFNKAIIALALPAQELQRAEAPELFNMVETLCVSRGLRTPRIAILETEEPNAFASGVNEDQYAITFTRGLIDLLTPEELEAVAAHELTHIRNGDVRMMVVAMIVAGVVTFFAELLFRFVRDGRGLPLPGQGTDGSRKERSRATIAIVFALFIVGCAWALSLMLRLALSRTREFLADAGAVELTKNPDAMISALRKLEGKGELPGVPSGLMEMCIANPSAGFADFFSSHPSIEDRVEALTRYAGGRDLQQIMDEMG